MFTHISVGDTIRVNVVFRDWVTDNDYGDVKIPDSVVVNVLNDEGQTISADEPRPDDATSGYYYDWTPEAEGRFAVEFVGIFSDGQSSVVKEVFIVDETYRPTATLAETQELFFVTDLAPVYIDPEELAPFYTEATPAEVVEHVYRYSLEVRKLFGDDPNKFPAVAFDYIRAATLCSLGKIYDYGLGGDASSLTLGDLSITSQSYPRNKITRANAANWCELAAVLRTEMRSSGTGMKAVVKGTRYKNPMPARHLRSRY